MCDYSLEHVASRPAVVGDKLTVTKFVSCTTGFSAAEDDHVAVCLLPGTEIAFDAPIQKFNFTVEGEQFEHSVAVFTQIKRLEMTWAYHKDALEMPDGKKILLNELRAGQTATVLQLPKQGEISHVELPADCETAEPNAPVQVGAPYYTEVV
jgi:hypothetical protein